MRMLVTGANGHVGHQVVRELLSRGHTVTATVRALDRARTARLAALPGLRLLALDIRDAAGFVAAATGQEVVVHVAATYAQVMKGRGAAEEMVKDAVLGATNAINAAVAARARKVVLTSSVVTLPLVRPGEPAVDETAWRTDLAVPYFRAKTEAERLAWSLAEERGIRLVTVLPGAVGGGGFARRTPTTDVVEGALLGTLRWGVPGGNLPYVDVRDVALAHALAAERDVAGRFIVCNDHLPDFKELVRALAAIDPAVPPPGGRVKPWQTRFLPLADRILSLALGSPRTLTAPLAAELAGRRFELDNRRAKGLLGWRQTVSFEDSLADLVADLKALRRREGRTRMI